MTRGTGMRRSPATDHTTDDAPSVPRTAAVSASTAWVRPYGRTRASAGHARRVAAQSPCAAAAAAHRVDQDVRAAVGRVLEQVLADRVARARALDPLFAADIAERVARFSRGGARSRSQLLWWSLRACGGADGLPVAAALRIGAALELLQTCALIHDDVIDGSALRRGRPTLHTEVREQYAHAVPPARLASFAGASAILAGDLALSWADDLLAETPPAPGTAPAVRRLWSDIRTEMVAGQYLDVHGQATASHSMLRARRTACLKSARYSVERPLALGAALARADEATRRELGRAGQRVGMAFQLRDDLNDVFGDPRITGKPAGGDIREGKPTYLIALARERLEAAGDRHALAVLEGALGRPDLTRDHLDQVRGILTATGVRDSAEARIEELVAQGLRHLGSAGLDRVAGRRLGELLHTVAGAGGGGTRAAGGDGQRAHGPGPGPSTQTPGGPPHDHG
ncbi:polyprenyl synthetase family protein, partial [Streptomyces sp. NPDC051597]|uniref:polyprenyl synthetase family protein n=1 Tax=Streptomyces sp. NPDC051597 TaxID=3155049 RepID=UPI0034457A4E